LMGPARLWRLSAALRRRGHRRLALLVKKLNSLIYHNSLAPGASFSPDVRFGHHGFGTVIHSNVEIGRGVMIWHNVTIAVRASTPSPHRIVIEDDVTIGANSVIVSPYEGSLRIGRGARIGAGAVVSRFVPPGATVVSAPVRVILDEESESERSIEDETSSPDQPPGEAPNSSPTLREGQPAVIDGASSD
jgi:serine O-acetyltransferase